MEEGWVQSQEFHPSCEAWGGNILLGFFLFLQQSEQPHRVDERMERAMYCPGQQPPPLSKGTEDGSWLVLLYHYGRVDQTRCYGTCKPAQLFYCTKYLLPTLKCTLITVFKNYKIWVSGCFFSFCFSHLNENENQTTLHFLGGKPAISVVYQIIIFPTVSSKIMNTIAHNNKCVFQLGFFPILGNCKNMDEQHGWATLYIL